MRFTIFNIKEDIQLPLRIIEEITNGGNIKFLPTEHINKILNTQLKDYYKRDLIELLELLIRLEYHSSIRIREIIGKDYKKRINQLVSLGIITNYIEEEIDLYTRTYQIESSQGVSILIFDDDDEHKDHTKIELDIVDDRILLETDIDVMSCLLAEYDHLRGEDNFSIKYSSRMNNVIRFKKGIRSKSLSKVGRVYTSLTSLSKVSRKYVSHNGEYFNEIDISNCVPYLLSLIINSDQDDFNQDCSGGVFYDKLMDKLSNIKHSINYYLRSGTKTLRYDSREDIKVMVMGSLLYGNIKNQPLLNAFHELYPVSSLHLNYLKTINDNLSHTFFKLESDIMLNLNLDIDFYTIHDALCFKYEKDSKMIIDTINNKILEMFPGCHLPKLDITINDRVIYNFDDVSNGDINDGVRFVITGIKERKKHKKHKPHKPHKQSKSLTENLKLTKVMLEQGKSRDDIIKALNINRGTYYRYLKKIK